MYALEFLHAHPVFFHMAMGIAGLIVGSFLNVVIARLPRMMKQNWQEECRALLEIDSKMNHAPFNLVSPRSQCPHCTTMIRAYDNIPVISFLLLKGKCRTCGERISLRYPAIEIISGGVAVITAAHFGISLQTIAAVILSWSLICLAMIDFDHQILPDDITLPLLWLGLIVNSFELFTDVHSSLFGAIFGYLSLWSVYIGFKFVTNKEGMGRGDFKLLAMLGAWLGWQTLPVIIIISSCLGAIVGLSMILFCGHNKNIPIPFGPYLAGAGWVALFWGQHISSSYFNWALSG